ncbi:MAG: Rpn family recombination-promoting nuclease/putative transposase [Caldilineaceae bacterium]|nr:Rpn family recombination-promoting nuclease/putative transposase [Caldilineaceae bacterium]
MPTIHDSGYKRLFSNPTIFRQLMESFVDQPWVAQLDFSAAETLDKSFVSDHYKETESDLIYRLPYGDGELYVYVLLEFQSTVDHWMALRMLNYVTNLYMDLLTSQDRLSELPPIFPILLYNGDQAWRAPTSIADLIRPEPSLGDYGLHFEFFKIAENEYSQEQLLSIRNIVSTLFLAEAHYNLEQLVQETLTLFDREADRRAVSLFINWFRQLAAHGRIEQTDFSTLEREFRRKEEVSAMLITALEREKQAWREEGREEGIEEGREEGREIAWREIVHAMRHRGIEVDTIADLTGQSVARILTYLELDPDSSIGDTS